MGVLDEKVAIVTGAAQGIGRGVATALAKEGASVAIVDRNEVGAGAVAADIGSSGGRALPIRCDVAIAGQVATAIHRTVDEWQRIDILVNNAQAVPPRVAELQDHSDEDLAAQLDSGLWGTFRFMRGCFPYLRQGGGRVINLGSNVGTHGMALFASYGAAKEGIRGLTKVAALDWGKYGITVNVICPAVLTESGRHHKDQFPEQYEAAVRARAIPRDGDAELDIGRTVVFLAGPDASFITGQTFHVNGGRAIMP